MKLVYVEKAFQPKTLATIAEANSIIEEYLAEGFRLTLRQLYYQFVARTLLPNTQRAYKQLGGIVSDGRLAGLIDWEAIEDRTRNLRANSHWEDPATMVEACAKQFETDKWASQPRRVQVWIEKDALLGVIGDTCKELDVPYFSCRGYVSQSEMWAAAQRFMEQGGMERKQTVILHLGDHDPSGLDMTRDIEDRMDLFRAPVEMCRIALTWAQIEEYGPPPNPAKTTDSRAEAYISEFGEDSWELDALDPRVLRTLISTEVLKLRNEDLWQEAIVKEERYREELQGVSDQWEDVVEEFLEPR